MKSSLILLFVTFSLHLNAQLSESFTDGDFTANPTWTGTASTFAVNTGFELQTSGTAAGTSYLSTPHGLTALDDKEWRIKVKMVLAGSASNFSRIFLTSSTDLSTSGDGFFLQLGEAGSLDAIRLKKIVSGVETEICAGPAAQIASSLTMNIKVIRNTGGSWKIYADDTGGTNFALLSTGSDAANLIGPYFGIEATYTASNATKFHFDNVYAGPEIIDSQAPSLLSVTPLDATNFSLQFDEAVAGASISSTSNYSFTPAIPIATVTQDGTNPSLLHVVLANSMTNGQQYLVTISTIQDISGNTASNLTGSFTYLVGETPEKGDLIISEFNCDPSPVIGLPELEFVEIYNRSTKYFNLSGWKIGDASADGTISSGWITPGEYKILCATSSQSSFPGSYSVTSFPSLNNSGDNIVLKDPALNVIDKLAYTDNWYRDDIKADGGYSIELININDPCSDASNWIASNDPNGGTPGTQNSVYDLTPDTQSPTLTGVFAVSNDLVQLDFSEGMDSVSLLNASFLTNPALTINAITAGSAFTDLVTISFATPMNASQVYTFTYGSISDCWLNAASISGSFALADQPQKGDIVVNEILFDPSTGGSDFIELYNRSQKIINLKNFAVANCDEGLWSSHKYISSNYLLFPNDYAVITANSAFVTNQFPQTVPGKFINLSLPSLNNDSSTIVLLMPDSTVCDLVAYNENWHLSVVDETENKTLERIDPDGVSNDKSNWHTAAESIGFGTPGKINSQYQVGGSNGNFGTNEPIFSPDNDGFQDVIMFYYSMPEGEMIATVNVYDDQGRLIINLKKSELLAPAGNFTWDGINDRQLKSQLGVYLAVIEAFSTDGTANFSKRVAFTLAGKLD